MAKHSRELEVREFLTVSTGHLSVAESKVKHTDWPVMCMDFEYGWFAYVGDMGLIDANKWPGLHAVGSLAKRRGIEYVLFDCDAGTVEGIPTYEW